MSVDPIIIPAAIAAIASIYSVWRTTRKEEQNAKIVASTESVRATVEFDVKKEELLNAGIESHFDRLEALVDTQSATIETHTSLINSLAKRVTSLETERETMLAWMAFNRLGWPPPEDFSSNL